LSILDAVIDNGIAGIAGTPGLKVVRGLIARGGAQAVIVKDLHRIVRDPHRSHAFARFCPEKGSHLCITGHTVNLDSMMDLADRVGSADIDELYAERKTRP
jgi:hypothetical protein